MEIQAIATVRGFARDEKLSSNEQRNLKITTYDDSPKLSVTVGERIVNNVGVIGTAIRAEETREYKNLAHFMQTWGNIILAKDLGFQ